MTDQTVVDPFDAAENPQVRQAEYWGQVQLDMFFAILQKGVGKVPFDPQLHSVDKRVTAIDIQILPITEQNISYQVQRNMIAENREWAGTVLPSIKALGLSVRELNGRYVHVRQKDTGSTYTNKDGEVKNRTTFEFVKLFASEDECVADFLAAGGAPAHTEQPAQQAIPANGNGNGGKEKETALQFLKVVVENSARGQTDLQVIQNAIATNIAGMPLINKYFTAQSPETLQLIMEKMAK